MKNLIVLLMLMSGIVSASNGPTPSYTFLWKNPVGFRNGYVNWNYNGAREPHQLNGRGQEIIERAMKVWSSYCSIHFNYIGPTDDRPMVLDGQNIFGWGETVPGAAAQTSSNHDYAEKFIVDSDVLYNEKIVKTESELFTISLHEVGHAIGLYHSDKENAVMSGYPLSQYTFLSDLNVDDVKGCQTIYPTFYPENSVKIKEYYREETDNFFLSSNLEEQNDLESGIHQGWKFTGQSFNVWDQNSELLRPVCRFYRIPDNHFFTNNKNECIQVQSWYHDWKIETQNAFYVIPAINGECVNNTKPVIRFFRPWGEPTHRYTTTGKEFQLMIDKNWVHEGIVFCTL